MAVSVNFYLCFKRSDVKFLNWYYVFNLSDRCPCSIYAIYCTLYMFGMSLLDYFYKTFATVSLG